MNWSIVTSSLIRTSALWIPYSFKMDLMVFSLIWVSGIVDDRFIPPILLFLTVTSGMDSLSLIPMFLSSSVMTL